MPLTVMHVLWANLIADIPPAMSLGVEPFEVDIMDRPPRPPKQAILTYRTWILILAQGFIQCSITFIFFVFTQSVDSNSPSIIKHPNAFLHATHPTEKEQRSLAFLILVSMQLVQSFYSRSVQNSVFKTGIFGNKWLIGAFFLSFGLLVMGYYIPGMNDFLELSPLREISWAIVFVALLLQLLIVEAFKWAYRYTEDRSYHLHATSPRPLK
jgi:Ca2+-transporting ATPase